MVLEEVVLLPSFYFLDKEVVKEGGGRKPLLFLKNVRSLRMDLVLRDPERGQSALPRLHTVVSLSPLRHDLSFFT